MRTKIYFLLRRQEADRLARIGTKIDWIPDNEEWPSWYVGVATCENDLAKLRNDCEAAIEYPLDSNGNPDRTKTPIADNRPTKAGKELLDEMVKEEDLEVLSKKKAESILRVWHQSESRL